MRCSAPTCRASTFMNILLWGRNFFSHRIDFNESLQTAKTRLKYKRSQDKPLKFKKHFFSWNQRTVIGNVRKNVSQKFTFSLISSALPATPTKLSRNQPLTFISMKNELNCCYVGRIEKRRMKWRNSIYTLRKLQEWKAGINGGKRWMGSVITMCIHHAVCL